MRDKLDISPKERLYRVFGGETADRTPILGGWIACAEHIAAIQGISMDDYWKDPVPVTIEAYRKLGTDGLVDVCVPKSKEDYRIVDADTYVRASVGDTLEDTIRRIEAMPSAEEIEETFDYEKEYAAFRSHLLKYQELCGEMLFVPAQWNAGAKLSWYGDLGYENFFMIVGLYPELARKLLEVGGAYGYCRSSIIARAVSEGIYPKAVFLGEDICTQRGPMISPDYLGKYYAPQLKHGLEPLLNVGCKPVWHCDGDVRSILDMLLDCGVKGFQGFQPECGMRIEEIVQKRTREGNRLLIYGPMSVTTELPVFTPTEIKARVRQVIDVCRGNADLVLFTSNTINPDVPLENIYAMYEAVKR
jgi:hypothetical protein